MKYRFLFCAFLLGTNTVFAEAELDKYPEIFESGDHTITVLSMGDKEALIKVDGINNKKLDGKIYKHKKICNNDACTNFVYESKEIPGEESWWTISQESSGWSDNKKKTFIYPGMMERQDMYAGKRPEEFNSQTFYEQYVGQKSK